MEGVSRYLKWASCSVCENQRLALFWLYLFLIVDLLIVIRYTCALRTSISTECIIIIIKEDLLFPFIFSLLDLLAPSDKPQMVTYMLISPLSSKLFLESDRKNPKMFFSLPGRYVSNVCIGTEYFQTQAQQSIYFYWTMRNNLKGFLGVCFVHELKWFSNHCNNFNNFLKERCS